VRTAYRPFADQEYFWNLYTSGRGALAARPGTSNHGWGLALDLDLDGAAQSWMREHGWQYGFVESVPREPWHWEYRPAGTGS
jgi:LAS superfamily LD-carboxypeptidase LdcB